MNNGKEITVRKGQSPASILSLGIEKGVDLDKLRGMLELQEKWEQMQARKAYSVAMANFKADPPEIDKDRQVKFKTSSGMTEYSHASLGNVTKKISSALSKHGLSAGWTTEQEGDKVKVTCIISHIMGHSERTSLTAALDNSGGKNAIQALGSTISYLERYTILALTGLATHDLDDDGASAVEYIDEQQLSTITDFINAKNVAQKKFLEYMKCESLETIPAADFNKAVAALKVAKGAVK